MNVDEATIKALLNEQIDHELAARAAARPLGAPAPPVATWQTRTTATRRRPWLLPLLAAASVVVVGAGVVGATRLVAEDDTVVPGHPGTSRTVAPAPASGTPTTSTPTKGTTSSPVEAGTQSVVVRPVRADGTAAAGYSVETESTAVDCVGDPSPVAVDPNIRFCGPSATNTLACWKAAEAGYVLCLRDPLTRTLARLPLSGTFAPVAAPKTPQPQSLVLSNGKVYEVRDGGAGARLTEHPTWIEWYIERKVFTSSVFGPPGSGGIDRTHARWTVHVYADPARPGVDGQVRTAYFVGTATN